MAQLTCAVTLAVIDCWVVITVELGASSLNHSFLAELSETLKPFSPSASASSARSEAVATLDVDTENASLARKFPATGALFLNMPDSLYCSAPGADAVTELHVPFGSDTTLN